MARRQLSRQAPSARVWETNLFALGLNAHVARTHSDHPQADEALATAAGTRGLHPPTRHPLRPGFALLLEEVELGEGFVELAG